MGSGAESGYDTCSVSPVIKASAYYGLLVVGIYCMVAIENNMGTSS